MIVLIKGKTKEGYPIQIEEWNENYSFIPYGSTLAVYKPSRSTHNKGQFSPKAGEVVRLQFDFDTPEETMQKFNDITDGLLSLTEIADYLWKQDYRDCI